jgi:hypothetical protein
MMVMAMVMVMVVAMTMSVLVFVRTGRAIHSSTAWLTYVTAAVLHQNHPPPKVAGELVQFLRQWHWLVHIGDETRKRWTLHVNSSIR